jgi:uncharacterized protein (DUF305 family)
MSVIWDYEMTGRIHAMQFLFISQQTLVGDRQFIRSMIPHHSGAIVMCWEANLNDPDLEQLFLEIIEARKQEIDQMEAILDRLEQ